MSSNSRSINDGRFDSATSLTQSSLYTPRFLSTTSDSPIDNEDIPPSTPYLALRASHPVEHNLNLPSRFPDASTTPVYNQPYPYRCLDEAAPSTGMPFTNSTYLSPDVCSSSASSDALTSGTDDTLYCSICGGAFTGKHGRGNLRRHMRHKHTAAETSLICQAAGCSKTFARQDARLKHERGHHPELHLNCRVESSSRQPISRVKKEPEGPPASSVNLDRIPVSTRSVLCQIRTQLNDEMWAKLCNMFFKLFPQIAECLQDKESTTYKIYMKVFGNMLLVVEAINSGSIDSFNQAVAASALRSRPRHTATASSSRDKSAAINFGPGSMSQKDLNSQSTVQKFTQCRENGSHEVATTSRRKNPQCGPVDCPYYKHWVMNPSSWGPPCNGFQTMDMAHVRQHLNRTRHQGRPGAWECRICKKIFGQKQSLEEHIEARGCHPQAQIRGDIVKSWARLYLILHPDEQRIPNPFSGVKEWLPQWIWEDCQTSLQHPPTSNQDMQDPFVDQREYPIEDRGHEMPHGADHVPLESHQADEDFPLETFIQMASFLSKISYATLANNHIASFNGDNELARRVSMYQTARRHGPIFRDLGQSFQVWFHEAENVEHEQLQAITNMAPNGLDSTHVHNQFQSPYYQTQGQDISNTVPTLPAEYFRGFSNTETFDSLPGQHESTQHESYQYDHNNQYSTPTASTRSSHFGVHTGSYLTQPLSVTNPSSAYGSIDNLQSGPSTYLHHDFYPLENSDDSKCATSLKDQDFIVGPQEPLDDDRYMEAKRPQPSSIDPEAPDQFEDRRTQQSDTVDTDTEDDVQI